MRVPFANIEATAAEVREESLAALARVYDRGSYILGPEVSAFEGECEAWFSPGAKCVGVSNGTDALVCALGALGIGRGHKVLTTPLTFFATVSAICRVGAEPIFVDVAEESYLIEPAPPTGPIPDAVVTVHLFGRAASVSGWGAVLPGVPVIEDAAQAWGALGAEGRVGALGAAGCFSFFPAKPLGACGDAGLIVTRDEAIDARCRSLRVHGRAEDGVFDAIGGNYRLDEMQAALLRVRLRKIEEWLSRRRNNARIYQSELEDLSGMVLPLPDTNSLTSAWSVFSIRVPERRDELKRYLASKGIGTAVYYPIPVHLQPALRGAWRSGQFPVAERLARELLALPIGPELDEAELGYVCDAVRAFFRS